MTAIQQNVDVATLEEAYRAFARGDIPAFLAVLDPRVAWTEAAGSAYAGTYVGPDDVVQGVFVRIGNDWESFVPSPSEFLGCGSTIVVLGRFDGVHRTTGASTTSRFAHVFRMEAGRVTAFESINDTHEIRRAMS